MADRNERMAIARSGRIGRCYPRGCCGNPANLLGLTNRRTLRLPEHTVRASESARALS